MFSWQTIVLLYLKSILVHVLFGKDPYFTWVLCTTNHIGYDFSIWLKLTKEVEAISDVDNCNLIIQACCNNFSEDENGGLLQEITTQTDSGDLINMFLQK